MSGDVEFAKYLVAQAALTARGRCSLDASEEDKRLAAAVAISQLVNKKGDNFSLVGTPVEIAKRYHQPALMDFLISHGAVASLSARLEVTRQLNTQMGQVIDRWGSIQKETKEVLDKQTELVRASQTELNKLTSITIAYQKLVEDESKVVEGNLQIAREVNERLAQMLALVNKTLSSRVVVNYWVKNHGSDR